MTTEESRALEMLGWYQEQHRILRDRCDSLTARVRAAEARIAELEQIIHDMRIENSGQAAEIERLRQAFDKAREALASVLCAEEPECPTQRESRRLCVEALQALNKLTELNTQND